MQEKTAKIQKIFRSWSNAWNFSQQFLLAFRTNFSINFYETYKNWHDGKITLEKELTFSDGCDILNVRRTNAQQCTHLRDTARMA
jgi:hypothetical protein